MIKISKTLLAGLALIASASMIAPAMAANLGLGVGVGVNANGSANGTTTGGVSLGVTLRAQLIARAQDRADQEITRRIDALNKLNDRVNNMVKLSADEKSNLSATIQSQITLMNTLQAQIATDAADNSTSSLKADIQSITKAYRIFMLIIPQGALDAAADRIMNVGDALSTISGKLQTRISAAQTAGHDTSAAVTLLADMNAKIADANTQSSAAVTETSSLKPDNGDQTIMQANVAAMKDARSKLHASQQDLVTARKDAGQIVQMLRSWDASANVEATSSVSATTSSE